MADPHAAGRPHVGVIVHHVASVYPIEIQLAQTVADGKPVTGVTMDDIDAMNAAHAAENARGHERGGARSAPPQQRSRRRGHPRAQRRAARQAAPVSLYADAPLTCQFVLEDHAVRHSYHHLAVFAGRCGRKPQCAGIATPA